MPASVIMLIMVWLGWVMVSFRRFGDCVVSQSQFWARRLWVGDLWDMAVQPNMLYGCLVCFVYVYPFFILLICWMVEGGVLPSENDPNAISVRTFMARISRNGTPAPSAIPSISEM